MTEIRFKDKVFLAIAVPLAVAAVYFWYLRPEAAAKLKTLEERDRATVTREEYPGEKRVMTARLKDAEAALSAERSVKPPEPQVVPPGDPSPARRTQAVVATFREAGVRVVSVSLAGDARGERAESSLRALKAMPSPVRRVYVLEGGYTAVKKAFRAFVDEKAAVIVSSLESQGADRWRVEIHE